jgi:hypothetical protein
MSHQTNLNVSPYFDDFDANNDYYKVLFKPGYPVQARELTTLQSILQNQIEKFGQHFFKDGAKVIPGNTFYNNFYECVILENTYLGIPVSSYADQLVGSIITGLTSGITATVNQVLLPQNSERGNLTLYINYLQSSTVGSETRFVEGEQLSSNSIVISQLLGTLNIPVGEPFGVTVSRNCTSRGSSFSISEGVYFIRGHFVNVNKESLILDQYSFLPNYRIGFFINEEIITSYLDENLNDNSQGFNNYSSPGADRLKITVSLFKKSLDDFDDTNFIELARVRSGIIKYSTDKYTQYNVLAEEFARRTYDESGDYYVKPFDVVLKNSLNDKLGNGGIFNSTDLTDGGSVPSDSLALYQISAGKAYVRGYELETLSTSLIDVLKPRETKTLENQTIVYNTGSTFKLNRVYGSPKVGIGNDYVLSLRDSRVGSTGITSEGKEIGVARVYDFRLESGSYDSNYPNLNEWNISLYDIQTTTEITLNEAITLNTPTFVKGNNSGATGFLKDSVSNSTSIVLYQTTGEFSKFESLIFDGNEAVSRICSNVTSYGISDVRSVYGTVGSGKTFSADVVQTTKIRVGIASIVSNGSFISITSTNPIFSGTNIKVGEIVKYTNPTNTSLPYYAKVSTVNATSIEAVGVTTVANFVAGGVPASNISVNDLEILTTSLISSQDNTLYSKLPKSNISNVDLTNCTLTIRKTFDNQIISSNKLIVSLSDQDETFLPFDEERYTLTNSNGSIQTLTRDKFSIDGNTLTISNVSNDSTGSTLVATIRKSKPKEKIKKKNRINYVIVNKSILEGSGTGQDTTNNGLVYGNYPYGTRVEDDLISLNYPDVIEIHGIFESKGTSAANPPSLLLSSIGSQSGKTSDLIIGEKIIGESSGSVAILLERKTDSEISYASKNTTQFAIGETLLFEESNIRCILASENFDSNDITTHYSFNSGQRSTFYDYSTVLKKSNFNFPTRQLKIYFSNAYYDSSDSGDITTRNSYLEYDYSKEVGVVDNVKLTDTIDIRPRVSPYTTTVDTRSPLEFYGRSFTSSGNSAKNSLASDESLVLNYSFYLGRIDVIYLNKTGTLQVKIGTSAEKPEKPVPIDDSLEIATINLPPYLYDTSSAVINLAEHKRYRMHDIKVLEDRIRNLEYYTSLSLLESKTSNLLIQDSNGLNKFKSGFFVDNFSDEKAPIQDLTFGKNNSIDPTSQELRPNVDTQNISLLPFNDKTTSVDNNNSIEGENVVINDGIITLRYTDSLWRSQNIATRAESVTPFILNYWKGSIELIPSTDTWFDSPIILEAQNFIVDIGDVDLYRRAYNLNESGTLTTWNNWQTTWSGTPDRTTTNTQNNLTSTTSSGYVTTTTTYNQTTTTNYETGETVRTGTQLSLQPVISPPISVGQRVVRRDNSQYIRSRNIQFEGKGLLPGTELKAYFDGVDVTDDCFPKLLEIEMLPGTGRFQIGENVIATLASGPSLQLSATLRVCHPRHKSGPHATINQNDFRTFFKINPYTNVEIPNAYSETSDILNVDTYLLSETASIEYSGVIFPNMILEGVTSRAKARVLRKRLKVDYSAVVMGSFFIYPAGGRSTRFGTGTRTFKLTNQSTTEAQENFTASGFIETVQPTTISTRTYSVVSNEVTETGQDQERILGTDVTQQITSVTVVDNTPPPSPPPVYTPTPTQPTQPTPTPTQPTQPPPPTPPTQINYDGPVYAAAAQQRLIQAAASVGLTGTLGQIAEQLGINNFERLPSGHLSQELGDRIVSRLRARGANICPTDPLAQSFTVGSKGVFLTKCVIYFQAKPLTEGIAVDFEIRSMANGTVSSGTEPSNYILDGSQVSKLPSEVNLSNDGSVGTEFRFKRPVYLDANKEYAIVLLSKSADYKVFISRVNETDLITNASHSNQEDFGSLFKSQNGTTWEPSQWEDLKYQLWRADFVSSGFVNFYNPKLTNQTLTHSKKLFPDSVILNSRKIRIGLASSLPSNSGLIIGNTILQSNSKGVGNYIGNAGSAFGTLSLINAGIGYTPSSGTLSFSNINLESITGDGRNATANITITNGGVGVATIVNGGMGYKIGDVLGISSIGSLNVGSGARVSISSISSVNELIVDNVQGDFIVSETPSLQYKNNVGSTVNLNLAVSNIIAVSDGLHIKINQKNHGMHSPQNDVIISGVESDIRPTRLSQSIVASTITSGGSISVDDSSDFQTFENVGVASTNPGYLLIGDEIIPYQSTSNGTINGLVTRPRRDYAVGTLVYKYELGGVSLRRINKQHSLFSVDTSIIKNPIEFDSYHIKLDMSSDGIDRSVQTSLPKLYINESKSTGGSNISASENMQFELIQPLIPNTTVTGTSISGVIRTTKGTSISGNEPSFVDAGFEPISIYENNFLDSPRIVCSDVNEVNNLSGQKSFNLRINLSSTDRLLSPTIDARASSITLVTNRINSVIDDYAQDNRVNSPIDDPTAFKYITKEVQLETSSTSIKILLDAYITSSSNIRAFYAISDNPNFSPIFIPFPGYLNLNQRKEVINFEDSDGLPDDYIAPSTILSLDRVSFREYTFTANNLPSFRYYRIKLIGTSSNQVHVPRVKNLRVIALA